MKYKYALVDADNTIFDFDRCEKEAIKLTFSMFNITPTDEMASVYHTVNDSYWKRLERKEVTHEELAVGRFLDVFEKFNLTGIDPIEFDKTYKDNLASQNFLLTGAYELLEYLHSVLDKVIVSSNGSKFIQDKRIATSNISKFITSVFTSQEAGANKPSTDFFDKLFGKYNIEKDKTILIGDSLTSDIQGAYNYKIDSIFFSPTGIKSDKATFTVTNLLDIKNIIK